jgi:hypothetical protein
MNEQVPPRFDETFLDWFRERTEQAWARHRPRDFMAARLAGRDWQGGTRWLNGLTDDQIDDVERQWSVRFPPDYRLFLRRLHSVDRPQVGAQFVGDKLRPAERPSFYNWLTDVETLREYLDWPLEGLLFDVENADLWQPAWGARPDTRQGRAALVRALAASAPRLIPIFSHRYLLAEPCRAGNPVFSVYQTDVIVYGADLRRYFLTEFGSLLGIERGPSHDEAADVSIDLASIPFWSAVWDW